METYNTIYYQKLFHQNNLNYQDTPPELYLTKLINNNFKPLSILYDYPYKTKYNSILQGFTFNFKLENNKKFTLNISKGMLVLDSTLITVDEDFQLVINDISISNYKYCNILFTVTFDYDIDVVSPKKPPKYLIPPNHPKRLTPLKPLKQLNNPSNLPTFNIYLYDSITGDLYLDNNYKDFDISKTIVLETYSIYHSNNNFTIVPYRKRLKITDVYDMKNYIIEKPKPTEIPKPYPNVLNDIPDYTHDHILTHNHCFTENHKHNSNYYLQNSKISENLNPPPQNIVNNILSLSNPILDILPFEYPLLLELFNKCDLEIINLNNLSFDFRYVDPYSDVLREYNKNKYDYSKLLDYRKIANNKILINRNNTLYQFPIRTHYYWLYILIKHDLEIDDIDFFNRFKYKYMYEDTNTDCSIDNCFCTD